MISRRCARQASAAVRVRYQPLAALALDLGRRGSAQLAAENPLELPGEVAAQPRAVSCGGAVEGHQQPGGPGVDDGHRILAADGHLGQPLAEPRHPVRSVA
jgi:hypothetical protein